MKVTLLIKGYLNKFFEQSQFELDLEEGATLADLLIAIDSRFGESLPKSIWAHEKKKFRGPVVVSIGEQSVSDPSFPLTDGQQVSISRFIIGG